MTIKKADLAEKIAGDCGFSKGEAMEVLQKLLEIIKASLVAGEEVMISGFGRWSVRQKPSRRGRNPSTGEPMILDARRVVTWKWSRLLKEACNRSSKKG